jgi:hypothetical protein
MTTYLYEVQADSDDPQSAVMLAEAESWEGARLAVRTLVDEGAAELPLYIYRRKWGTHELREFEQAVRCDRTGQIAWRGNQGRRA